MELQNMKRKHRFLIHFLLLPCYHSVLPSTNWVAQRKTCSRFSKLYQSSKTSLYKCKTYFKSLLVVHCSCVKSVYQKIAFSDGPEKIAINSITVRDTDLKQKKRSFSQQAANTQHCCTITNI